MCHVRPGFLGLGSIQFGMQTFSLWGCPGPCTLVSIHEMPAGPPTLSCGPSCCVDVAMGDSPASERGVQTSWSTKEEGTALLVPSFMFLLQAPHLRHQAGRRQGPLGKDMGACWSPWHQHREVREPCFCCHTRLGVVSGENWCPRCDSPTSSCNRWHFGHSPHGAKEIIVG